MNLFNMIRSIFGLRVDVDDDQPIDRLDQLSFELGEKRAQLSKAQQEFDELNTEFTLKIMACDKLIEKGVKEGDFNKQAIKQRLDRLTDEFLTNVQVLSKEANQLDKQKIELEGDILAKAIDLTSRLTKDEQQEINDIIVTWRETGLIKGEQVNSQMRAIVMALDEIVKGGEGSRGGNSIITKENKEEVDRENAEKERIANWDKKREDSRKNINLSEGRDLQKSHEPLVVELAGKGDIEYDSPVAGHYANVIVKDKDGKILFLKRASDKVVAPDQYCLPGGHIDEGETIEQAACRELKEEANLECDYCYVIGKAKCDDGKWAFYLTAFTQYNDVALLDGESVNAHWMSRDQWIEADLIFDLKDHLVAIETKTSRIKDIPDIMKGEEDDDELEKGKKGPGSRGGKIIGYTKTLKPIYAGKKGNDDSYRSFSDKDHGDAARIHREVGEHEQAYTHGVMEEKHKFLNDYYDRKGMTGAEQKKWAAKAKELGIDLDKAADNSDLEKVIDINNPFYYDNEDDLIKGKAAQEGEERTWGGKRYKKQGGKWLPVGSGKKKGEGKEESGETDPTYKKWEKMSDGDLNKLYDKFSDQFDNSDDKAERAELKQDMDAIDRIQKKRKERLKKQQQKPLSTKQLKEHVENTSTEQLKKVAKDDKHPHNDVAKRELERRGDNDSEWDKLEQLETKFNSGNKMSSMLQLVEHLTGKKKFEDFDKEVEAKLFKISDEVSSKNLSAMQAFGRIAKALGKTIGG